MAQRDPLVEYQREGYNMFSNMMEGIKEESVGYVFNLEVQVDETPPAGAPAPGGAPSEVVAKGLGAPRRPAQLQYSAPHLDGDPDAAPAEVRSEPARAGSDSEYGDVPRNAPCPCGSGKKYKRCHGDPRSRVS
jgi:preprotein translocase subunit SecA